jgi:hypothetical protein
MIKLSHNYITREVSVMVMVGGTFVFVKRTTLREEREREGERKKKTT